MTKERLGSLVSGSGSTMEKIVIASKRGELNMDIGCVIAGSEGIGAITRAKKLEIPVEVVK
jgi:folate-dependent phosphoribosylglycinamide formyltransferase PurN